MIAKEFYYQVADQVVGPVSGGDLRQKALDGSVTLDTPVRVGANGDWVPATRLKGLFADGGSHPTSAARQPAPADTKTCAYCAETILAAAIKCKHCGEFLDGARPGQPADSPPPSGASRLRVCPDCGHNVSKHARKCPTCGRPLEEPACRAAPAPAGENQQHSPARVKHGNEAIDNARVALAVFGIICWGVVVMVFSSNPDDHQYWFFSLFITAVVCAILGAVVGSFKKAGDIGGLLGALFGPLGVIGALAIDGRPQCPKCGARLDGAPEVCPYCHVELLFASGRDDARNADVPCPVCRNILTSKSDVCVHCSAALTWVAGRPRDVGQYQMAEASRKFSPELLQLVDSQGPVSIGIDYNGSKDLAMAHLRKVGFDKHESQPSLMVQLITLFGGAPTLRGSIDATKLRELASLPCVLWAEKI